MQFLLLLPICQAIVYPGWNKASDYHVSASAYSSTFAFKGCSATMIDDTHAITAAHCLFGDNGGAVKAPFTVTLSSGKRAKIATYYKHPCFTGDDSSNSMDIAILVFQSAPGLKPVRMWKAESMGSTVQKQFFFLGYGDSGPEGNREPAEASNPKFQRGSNVILAETDNVLEYKLCNNKSIKYQGLAWSGDSGGPLYVISNGQGYLAGANSGGDCCQFGSSDQFVNLSSKTSQDWIWNSIKQKRAASTSCSIWRPDGLDQREDRNIGTCKVVPQDLDNPRSGNRPMPALCVDSNCNNPNVKPVNPKPKPQPKPVVPKPQPKPVNPKPQPKPTTARPVTTELEFITEPSKPDNGDDNGNGDNDYDGDYYDGDYYDGDNDYDNYNDNWSDDHGNDDHGDWWGDNDHNDWFGDWYI